LKTIYKFADEAAISYKIELKKLVKFYEKEIENSDYLHKNDMLDIISNSKEFMN